MPGGRQSGGFALELSAGLVEADARSGSRFESAREDAEFRGPTSGWSSIGSSVIGGGPDPGNGAG